jgi:hypothetical protein
LISDQFILSQQNELVFVMQIIVVIIGFLKFGGQLCLLFNSRGSYLYTSKKAEILCHEATNGSSLPMRGQN